MRVPLRRLCLVGMTTVVMGISCYQVYLPLGVLRAAVIPGAGL